MSIITKFLNQFFGHLKMTIVSEKLVMIDDYYLFYYNIDIIYLHDEEIQKS